MTANVMTMWGEILSVAAGGIVLLVFGLFFPSDHPRTRVLPGSSGRRVIPSAQKTHEQEEEEQGGEVVNADGFIDSFGGVIEEAGGGLPSLVKLSLIAVPLWWLVYLILNWSQRFISMRTFIF